jgi:hypothetical protein
VARIARTMNWKLCICMGLGGAISASVYGRIKMRTLGTWLGIRTVGMDDQ